MQKNPLLFLFLGVISLFFPSSLFASHTAGGEITYKCTANPGFMEVTLVYYRDCGTGGIELCAGGCGAACTRTMTLMGADPSCQSYAYGSITLNLVSVRDVNANTLCPNAKNSCTNMGCVAPGTYHPAFERYEFKGIVNIGSTSGIPLTCCNVRFVYEECCRSGAISTGSYSQNLYLDAVVNRCASASSCNSSPVFTNEASVVINGGENFVYNNAVEDPEHDSLTFSFAPALQGYGTPISYTPPFAYDRPMPWTGMATGAFPAGIRCDSATGDIMFTPGNSGGTNFTGVVAIEIKQWKKINGVPTVIGITRRDMMMVLLANGAPNNPPRFKTIPPAATNPNAPQTSWDAIAGEQLCFTVLAKDTDFRADSIIGNPPLLSDTTFLSMNGEIMTNLGATFLPTYTNRTVNGPREDSYQFCWTPDAYNVSNNPYYFTISAKDSRCPNPGKITRAFSVKVRGSATYTPTKQDMGCGNWKIGYTTVGEPFDVSRLYVAKVAGDTTFALGVDSFSNIQTTTTIKRPLPGKYLFKIVAGWGTSTVTQYDTLTVVAIPLAVNTPDTIVVCSPASVSITATAANGAGPYQYRWFNSISDTSFSPLHSTATYISPVISSTTYKVVQLRDTKGCRAYDSTRIVAPLEVKSLTERKVSCFGLLDGGITLQMKDTLFPYQYKLGTGAYQSGNVFSGLPAGTFTISVKDTGTCGVVNYPITVTQPELLRDTLTAITLVSCYASQNATFITLAKGGTSPYVYSLDSIQYSSNRYFTGLAAGKYTIHIKDDNGCYASVTRTIAPKDSLTIVVEATPSCENANTGKLLLKVSGGTKPYRFKFGSNPIVNDSVYHNLPAGKYGYAVLDGRSCTKSDSAIITQVQITASAIIGSGSVYMGDTQTYSVTPQTGVSYLWAAQQGTIVGTSNTSSVNVKWTALGAGEVQVIMYTDLACGDTSTLAVSIGNTGVHELSGGSSGISMYPNPVTHTLNVSIEKLVEGNRIQLFDINGRMVYDQVATTQQSISMDGLASGMYLLRVGNWQQKVVKE